MNRRFPLNVRIIGLVQNQRQKTYLSSVLWSDRSDVIVYRTFEEFKKLHKTVVKKYPLEAGRIKKSDRVLPKFQDVSLKERRSAGVGKSVMRMRVLEKYCSELLRSTVKISSDQDVSQFFLPTDSDLAPSFPSDSVIILPSATERNTNSWRRPNYAQTITQPVASENYKCVAAYEGKDTENRPFKVLEDEIVDVITKNSSGWWLVENERKQLAWFPAPYLRRSLNSAPSRASENEMDDAESQYYAVKNYEATAEDELSMHIGVIVEVLKKSSDGWWLVRYNKQSGFVPSIYLQPYRNPHSKFQLLTKAAIYSSTPNLIIPDKEPHTQLTNEALNKADNSFSTTDVKKGLHKDKSKSINCLADENLFEKELSSHSSNQTESRSDSLSDNASLSTISSGKSGLSEDSSSDGSNTSPCSVYVPVLFLKNQISQRTSKNLNDEKIVELKSGPEASTSGSNSDKNLTPKIPPRPQQEEILSRCTTITKNMVLKSQNYFGFKNYETQEKIIY
ncbi:NADPH oxidase organizer 1-like [Narcine bancroftii]|uniref:NADPH oxidase organizer 1-like n=1 Tax=Narcine bancroftii TaxID=1343680 RepID=UPI003832140C